MYEYLETEKEMIQSRFPDRKKKKKKKKKKSRFDAVGTLKAVQKNRKTCIGTRY